jgi:hypothetical protein
MSSENAPASIPLASRIAAAPGVDSKTHPSTAFSAPCRTTSLEAFPPSNSASASIKIDLPAPVSPVSRFNPGPKLATAWSITA